VAEEGIARVRSSAKPSPLAATVDEPRLIALEGRAPIPPISFPEAEVPEPIEVDLSAPPDSGIDVDALMAQAESELAALDAPAQPPAPNEEREAPPPLKNREEIDRELFGEQQEERALLLSRAKGFFEDLSMMGIMRRPGPSELWRSMKSIERRLFARLDAIFACGDWVLPELGKLLQERPVPDPELTWGALLVFGSLSGDDSFEQVLRLVRISDLNDEAMFESVADALSFIPHPRLETELRSWLNGTNASPRRLSLRALGRRRCLATEEALNAAASPDLSVAREGARGLAASASELTQSQLSPLLTHADEQVVVNAIEAALIRRMPAGAARAVSLVSEGRAPFARAAVYAAIGANKDSLAAFKQEIDRKASPVLTEALGWFGHLDFVPYLLSRLKDGDAPAAAALHRITGAALTDDSPQPEYQPDELPFTEKNAAFPPPGLTLTAKAEAWEAWWKEHGARARSGLRYRWGHLFSAADLVWELEEARAAPEERRLAYLELAARAGGSLPFDPADFVSRQERQLQDWKRFVQTHPRAIPPGSWAVGYGR